MMEHTSTLSTSRTMEIEKSGKIPNQVTLETSNGLKGKKESQMDKVSIWLSNFFILF